MSIPAIGASGLLELREAMHILPADAFVPLIAGVVSAAIVGYLSIWFLIAFLRKNSTLIFIIYRLVLGSVLLILLWQGVLNPAV